MIDRPEVTNTDTLTTAVIRFTIPRAEIKTVMGPGFAELMATLETQGLEPIGPAFAHHFRVTPGIFDFEIGVPVATPVTPTGRVQASRLPARKVARAIYRGPYDGLEAAWAELDAWMTARGHTPAPGLVERYLVGPGSESDPSRWQTELVHPVASA